MKDITDVIWTEERVPNRWKKGMIFRLPKKGILQHCENWRGITLLPIISKVLSSITISRMRDGVEAKLREEQAAYVRGRGTTEHIFTLRNIIEQSLEWQTSLYVHFVDFEKAFDSIHRESLWTIMKSYGIPPKIINIVKAFYDDFECAILDDDGDITEWLKIKTGIKQGCNISGFLFLLVIDFVMTRALRQDSTGLRWKFTSKLEDLDFDDDVALLSSSKEEHTQTKTNRVTEEEERVGLKVNIKKCKLLRLNARNKEPFMIKGQEIEDLDKFVYLGTTVSNVGGTEELRT
mgnify:CR=1 FL=1